MQFSDYSSRPTYARSKGGWIGDTKSSASNKKETGATSLPENKSKYFGFFEFLSWSFASICNFGCFSFFNFANWNCYNFFAQEPSKNEQWEIFKPNHPPSYVVTVHNPSFISTVGASVVGDSCQQSSSQITSEEGSEGSPLAVDSSCSSISEDFFNPNETFQNLPSDSEILQNLLAPSHSDPNIIVDSQPINEFAIEELKRIGLNDGMIDDVVNYVHSLVPLLQHNIALQTTERLDSTPQKRMNRTYDYQVINAINSDDLDRIYDKHKNNVRFSIPCRLHLRLDYKFSRTLEKNGDCPPALKKNNNSYVVCLNEDGNKILLNIILNRYTILIKNPEKFTEEIARLNLNQGDTWIDIDEDVFNKLITQNSVEKLQNKNQENKCDKINPKQYTYFDWIKKEIILSICYHSYSEFVDQNGRAFKEDSALYMALEHNKNLIIAIGIGNSEFKIIKNLVRKTVNKINLSEIIRIHFENIRNFTLDSLTTKINEIINTEKISIIEEFKSKEWGEINAILESRINGIPNEKIDDLNPFDFEDNKKLCLEKAKKNIIFYIEKVIESYGKNKLNEYKTNLMNVKEEKRAKNERKNSILQAPIISKARNLIKTAVK